LNVQDPYQRGALIFAYFGGLFQIMRGVAPLILRQVNVHYKHLYTVAQWHCFSL
jgi:hypothetical protein